MKHCTNCGGQIEEGDGFCENCGHKVDIAPILPASVSPTILEKEKAEQVGERVDSSKELYFIAIALGVFFAVFLIVVLSANKSSDIQPPIHGTDVSTPQPPPITSDVPKDAKPEPITNPDYLKNQSGYLIDYDYDNSSQIPIDKPLWVEGVNQGIGLKISYPIIKAEKDIIIVKILIIPGLDYEKNDEAKISECKTELRVDFLSKYLLHKEIYLVSERLIPNGRIDGWRLLVSVPNSKDMQDVAAFIVRNGYAFAGSSFTSPQAFGANYFLPYPTFVGTFTKDLKDELEVAQLAKRGYWGTCQ